MRTLEAISVVLCLLFAIAISLYHVSYNGYLGLSDKVWGSVWAISENGLALVMSFIVIMFSHGTIRLLFTWLFLPYFTLKLIYHFSCLSGIYLFSPQTWEYIWGIILVLLIGLSLLLTLTKLRHA